MVVIIPRVYVGRIVKTDEKFCVESINGIPVLGSTPSLSQHRGYDSHIIIQNQLNNTYKSLVRGEYKIKVEWK